MLPWQIQFGLIRFRSPLLAESQLISLPRPTQMLHFGQFVLPSVSKGVYREISFGNLGIYGRMHLPQAYRSLPRPSSLIKPSHPPTGVFAPVPVQLLFIIFTFLATDCPVWAVAVESSFGFLLVPFIQPNYLLSENKLN